MSKNARPLSLAEIGRMREKLLDNTAALIDDAGLLFAAGRFARAFSLSVIAIEEASKIPTLLEAASTIAKGESPNWAKLQEFLTSHRQKLMANLLQAMRLQSPARSPRWVAMAGRKHSLVLPSWTA